MIFGRIWRPGDRPFPALNLIGVFIDSLLFRGGGGIECPWHDVSGVSREGGEYERGVSPLIQGVRGVSPGKIWKVEVPEKHF